MCVCVHCSHKQLSSGIVINGHLDGMDQCRPIQVCCEKVRKGTYKFQFRLIARGKARNSNSVLRFRYLIFRTWLRRSLSSSNPPILQCLRICSSLASHECLTKSARKSCYSICQECPAKLSYAVSSKVHQAGVS